MVTALQAIGYIAGIIMFLVLAVLSFLSTEDVEVSDIPDSSSKLIQTLLIILGFLSAIMVVVLIFTGLKTSITMTV